LVSQSSWRGREGALAGPRLTYIPDILEEHFEELEFLWGQRTDSGGAKGIDQRIQMSAHYKFSTKDVFGK
jgi:hypothetical protein